MKLLTILCALLLLTQCNNDNKSLDIFDVEKVKPIIKKRSLGWKEAIQTKNISIIKNLYATNAHYLPNDDKAIHGINDIVKSWETSFAFFKDIQLNMNTLEGNKNLLYETGDGFAYIFNNNGGVDTFDFKYVNVWSLDEKGIYKVVIDTYNNNKR